MSLGQFGTSAKVSQHFMKCPKCRTVLGPKCLGSEVSIHPVRAPGL